MPPAYASLGETLTLGNDWLERQVSARAGAPAVSFSLVNRQSGGEYLRPASREFSVSVNGQPLSGADCLYHSGQIIEGEPLEVVLDLQALQFPLALEIHFEVFSHHPVVRKWLVLRNLGTKRLTLSNLDWEDLQLVVDSAASAEVWSDYFTRRDKSALVTMDDCVLLVNDPTHQEGFIIATIAPGPLKRLEAYAQPGRVAAGYNRDDETIFERILEPGESFQTPASFLLVFAHPIPQEVVDGAYARFVAERLTICEVGRVPSITVNTWQPFEFQIDRVLLREQIEIAAELGVDAYQVDAGWYDRMGDWNVDPQKFPAGLEEIAEHARSRGMRFGLWLAAAAVDEESRVRREHPEWLALDPQGHPNRHQPGTMTMCLDSPFFDFSLAKLDQALSRYGVELLKLDLSAVRNLYAPGRYPGCSAPNHGHRSPRESHVRILERMLDLVRALKAHHPDCLVDVTYELYGVMDGTDLGLTQVADQNWFTNLASPDELNLRREIYQRGRVTAPWTLNFGGARLDHPTAAHYGLFSTLTSHAMFWGDLAKLAPEERAYYRRWFAWVKKQRAYRDFYRYYQVGDVWPPPDGVSSRDYRHAVPAARYGLPRHGAHPPAFDPVQRAPGEFWDGAARLDPRGEGPIFLFRPAASPEELFRLRVPWVDPAGRYRIEDMMEEREMGDFSGAELREVGIDIRIPRPEQARVIVLRRI